MRLIFMALTLIAAISAKAAELNSPALQDRRPLVNGERFESGEHPEFCGIKLKISGSKAVAIALESSNPFIVCGEAGRVIYGSCTKQRCEFKFNRANPQAAIGYGPTLNGWELNILSDGSLVIRDYIWEARAWQIRSKAAYKRKTNE